jgi:hypothetical protein
MPYNLCFPLSVLGLGTILGPVWLSGNSPFKIFWWSFPFMHVLNHTQLNLMGTFSRSLEFFFCEVFSSLAFCSNLITLASWPSNSIFSTQESTTRNIQGFFFTWSKFGDHRTYVIYFCFSEIIILSCLMSNVMKNIFFIYILPTFSCLL